jgi:hypothetical protein
MASFRFRQRQVADPRAQENFEQLEAIDAIGLHIVSGQVVGTTGAIAAGSGFTVVRTAVGAYTVTFTKAFSAPPAVTFGAVGWAISLTALPTGTGFGATVFNTTTGANIDRDFCLAAIGPR